MYRLILAIFAISLTTSTIVDGAPALATARQFLPALPGYIPVYIRTGDTPLEEINPELAAAFNSYANKHARLAFGRSLEDVKKKEDSSLLTAEVSEVTDISLVHLDEDFSLEDNNDVSVSSEKTIDPNEAQHIQKIPRS